MRRFRDAILGIFEEIISRRDLVDRRVITRRTRAHGSNSTDLIPFTGGLRILAAGQVVLVDADRSGGITRLLHCWEFLARNDGIGQVHMSLYYVLLLPSNGARDYYRSTWEFVRGKAQVECGTRLRAFFASCERPRLFEPRAGMSPSIIEHAKAELRGQGMLTSFEAVLAGNAGRNRVTTPMTDLEIKPREERRLKFDPSSL